MICKRCVSWSISRKSISILFCDIFFLFGDLMNFTGVAYRGMLITGAGYVTVGYTTEENVSSFSQQPLAVYRSLGRSEALWAPPPY